MMRSVGVLLRLLLLVCGASQQTCGFSTPNADASFALFDRFRPACPADLTCIRHFDASLVQGDDHQSTWVAVYRAANNKPSVFVKDEFLNAMRMATGVSTDASSNNFATSADSNKIETNNGMLLQTPVAVARLRPSNDFSGTWVLDSMRCLLKKEDTDAACDGGSQHTEALSVAIDSLLLHHLKTTPRFEGAIRTKATLVSSKLLEDRGFRPVSELCKDMATHISSLDACMERYAERVVTTSAKHPSARDRALQILSFLGQMDRAAEFQAAKALVDKVDDDTDDYDPWAGIKQFL